MRGDFGALSGQSRVSPKPPRGDWPAGARTRASLDKGWASE